jgi:hypothetical protein
VENATIFTALRLGGVADGSYPISLKDVGIGVTSGYIGSNERITMLFMGVSHV